MTEREFDHGDGTVRKEHYGRGMQPWDHIVIAGWGPEFAAGNALKYVRRFRVKNGDDDLAKGRWYFAELIKMMATGRFTVRAAQVYSHLYSILTDEERELLENKP